MASYSSRVSASSPRMAAQKGVTIYDEPEHIEPRSVTDYEAGTSPTLVASNSPKRHRASISGKKMTGRPPLSSGVLSQGLSYLSLDNANESYDVTAGDGSKTPDPRVLLSQVAEWLHEEKTKRQKKKYSKHQMLHHRGKANGESVEESTANQMDASGDSQTDLSLDRLESILAGFTPSTSSMPRLVSKNSSALIRKGSIAKKFKRASIAPQSSDTEFFGDDALVPNVEATLDNTKTLAFTGGTADAEANEGAKRKDYEHWVTFKQEIVRLTHTLKLKGWRRIPIEQASDIEVSRLSGALTNAVYVVRPPKDMSQYQKQASKGDSTTSLVPMARPVHLLLRIYGPQVEHLIDRESELAILRRLGRKSIGPRMLGTFHNGRFEEFLHAKTLTAEDLRVGETSKQIAKRMRELHDGIELLESEYEAGPVAFENWDKWVDRAEKVMTWLDQQVLLAEKEPNDGSARSKINPRYVRRGLVCGVEWPVFRKTYEAYRKRLVKECGGAKELRKNLVFAHNDTQYGNLMRVEPSGTSPLMQPANHHKQLVVIDFEYAGQSTRGYEFADHFTEWCYNYHHQETSHVCDTRRYPNEKEQYRFMRSYVMHRPQFNPSASGTPKMEAREKTNISDFMLDARTPSGVGTPSVASDYEKEEKERERAQEEEIQKLLHETRVWRVANSAFWVAWGIVQAKVPELDEEEKRKKEKRGIASSMVHKVKEMAGRGEKPHPMSDPLDDEEKRIQEESRQDRPEGREQEEAHREGDDTTVADPSGGIVEEPEHEDEEFDYLAYTQERAMFFWGDCVQMGIVKEEDLPEALRKSLKMVPY